MDRIKALVREPALLIDFAESLLVLLVAFGVSMNGDQQSYIIAALVAFAGLAKGFTTTPFPVSVVPDFGRAVLVLGMAFGLNVNADQTAIIVTVLGTLTTIVARAQITPRLDPVVAKEGSGAGPVYNERGAGELWLVGVVILVVGAILIVLTLVDALAVPLVVGIITALVGLAIVVLSSGRRTRV